MDFLLSRRSLLAKDIAEPGPGADELQRIIEAGLRVPDHGRCAPWRIQVLDKDAQARLGDILAGIYSRNNPDAADASVEMERERPQRAPVLLVVSAYPNMERIEKVPLMEQRLSGGALCQNILNGAHALGYTAQWLTEWPAYDAEVKRALGHSPETEIIGFIYIGTAPDAPSERARARPEDVVSHWRGPDDAPIAPGIQPPKPA